MEGLARWNQDRATAAVNSAPILGKDIISSHRPPAVYTAEKFGVEYLYAQLEANMEVTDSNVDQGVETVEVSVMRSPRILPLPYPLSSWMMRMRKM